MLKSENPVQNPNLGPFFPFQNPPTLSGHQAFLFAPSPSLKPSLGKENFQVGFPLLLLQSSLLQPKMGFKTQNILMEIGFFLKVTNQNFLQLKNKKFPKPLPKPWKKIQRRIIGIPLPSKKLPYETFSGLFPLFQIHLSNFNKFPHPPQKFHQISKPQKLITFHNFMNFHNSLIKHHFLGLLRPFSYL